MADQLYAQVLDILAAIMAGLVALRFLQLGLYRRFPYFFVYCAFSAVRGLSFLLLPRTSDGYFYAWIVTQPMVWFFYISIVMEIYRAATAEYSGIQSLGRKVMWVGLGGATAISAISLMPKLNSPATMAGSLGICAYVERGLYTAILLFLLLMVAFLWHYPIRMNHNLMAHLLIFTVFFFANNILVLLRAYFGYRASNMLNNTLDVLLIGLRAGWLVVPVAQEGERNLKLRFQLGAPEERRLMQQLGMLNANLAGSGKRWS